MTAETIINYFLTAGASYRNSEAWHKLFDDEKGKSTVLRSGRFGIGALAAFLLGGEINVSTRHVGALLNDGIAFKANLDSDIIELYKMTRPVGTTIRIKITKEIYDKLLRSSFNSSDDMSWDWYTLIEPCVLRLVNGESRKQVSKVPPPNCELPLGWHRITHKDFQDVQWTYAKAPYLTHNGIVVLHYNLYVLYGAPQEDNLSPTWASSFTVFATGLITANFQEMMEKIHANNGYSFQMPNISVFDANGNLPLNLQRTGLTQEAYPFNEELLEDVIKDFLAFTLVTAPTQPANLGDIQYLGGLRRYPGVKLEEESAFYGPMWLYTNDGVSLADTWVLKMIDCQRVMCLYSIKEKQVPPLQTSLLPLPYPQPQNGQAVMRRVCSPDMYRQLSEMLQFDANAGDTFKRLSVDGKRILVPKTTVESNEFQSEFQGSTGKEEWSSDEWVLWKFGHCPETTDVPEFVSQAQGQLLTHGRHHFAFMEEIYLSDEQPDLTQSLVASMWEKILGDPVIPYDLKERQKKFAHAYKELATFIAAYATSDSNIE